MSEKVEKIFLWIIKSGTVIILFLPLLVYQRVFYPYIFPKIIAFQVLVEIIFAAWLFLGIYNRKYRPDFKNPLVIALTIFMGILFLTSLTGADFAKSFWSTQERMTGVLSILHFYAFFIVLVSAFKSWKDWKIFIWASLICSFLVGLYGLAQKFAPQLGLNLSFLLKGGGRMQSTLGNPIFLAVYSMLHVFLAGFLLFREKKTIWRIIIGFLAVFNLTIMLMAASRGVMLAFGFSLFLFILFLIFRSRTKIIKIISGIILVIFISGLIFIQLPIFEPLIYKMPGFVPKLAHLTSGAEDRLDAWIIGLKGFGDKPVLGYGWENYNLIFDKYYQPRYLAKGMEATWFDHSHNQVIDIMALTGILGILSYLLVFGAIFWLLFKKIKILDDLKRKIPFVILGLTFLAYFIQNLFVFDTPAPLIVFYFSLGLVAFITKSDANCESRLNDTNNKPGDQLPKDQRARFPLPILILLVVVFLPCAVYKFNIEPFQQSRLGITAWNTAKVDLKSGLYWFEKALDKPCFVNSETRVYLARTIAEGHDKISLEMTEEELDTLGQGTELAIAEYKKNVQDHPLNARYWLYLGQLYSLGVKYDRSYIEEAKKTLNTALELSPKRQQTYFELARIYYYEKNYQKALDLLEQAVVLAPEVKESVQKLERVIEAVEKEKPDLEEIEKARKFLEYLNR